MNDEGHSEAGHDQAEGQETGDDGAEKGPHLLDASVNYVRGWREANEATVRLRAAATRRFGRQSFGGLRADVDLSGRGRVDLGPIPADRALDLARVLRSVLDDGLLPGDQDD